MLHTRARARTHHFLAMKLLFYFIGLSGKNRILFNIPQLLTNSEINYILLQSGFSISIIIYLKNGEESVVKMYETIHRQRRTYTRAFSGLSPTLFAVFCSDLVDPPLPSSDRLLPDGLRWNVFSSRAAII